MAVDISMGALIRSNEARFPDRVAYVQDHRALTFAELALRGRKLAGAIHKLGAGHQDRVAILAMNCLEYGEFFSACEQAGYISVPVNYRLTADEVLATLLDSGSKTLVFAAAYTDLVSGIRDAVPATFTFIRIGGALDWAADFATIRDAGDSSGPPFRGAGPDIASLIYTSGSTGRPKGCIIGQHEYARLGQIVSGGMRMSPFDCSIVAMPLFHNGAKALQTATHWRGGKVVIMPEFRPMAYLEAVQTHRATTGLLGPTLIQMLIDEPTLGDFDTSSLRLVMYSTAAMPPALVRKAIATFGNIFQNSYGATEAPAMLLEPEQHLPDGSEGEQGWLSAIGVPYPTVEARLVRDDGTDASAGESGEIVVRSEGMFRGYWNNAEATHSALKEGWYHTGDLGRRDEHGFYHLVGRKKDMIITGGENVVASEVENVLRTHPAVLEVSVIGVPHPKWGETVCAIVVVRPGARMSEDQVVAHSRANLASYKKPGKVVFVESLPQLASGKVDKMMLRRLYSG